MKSPNVPTDGSENCSGKFKLKPDEVDEIWRKRNQCQGVGKKTPYGESFCQEWSCTERTISCRVDGGRLWPGTAPRLFQKCEETPARNFPTTQRVFDFLFEAPEADEP